MKCTQSLTKAIQEDEEYKNFLKIKEKADAFPELKKQINDFRKRNYELQNSGDSFEMFSEIEKLEKDYQEIRKNPVSSEYLRTELAVCRMLQRINYNLLRALDLDLDDVVDSIQ